MIRLIVFVIIMVLAIPYIERIAANITATLQDPTRTNPY